MFDKIVIPAWLVAIGGIVFLGVILEQLYISKSPVDIWGLKLNQPNKPVSDTVLSQKGVVLISYIPCNDLDGKWKPFESAAGRFLIGIGATTDDAGITLKFKQDQVGGEFSHQLTVPEMPTHSHTQIWGQHTGNLNGDAVGNDIVTYRAQTIQETGMRGGGHGFQGAKIQQAKSIS